MRERLRIAIERYHAKNDALWALMPPLPPPTWRVPRWSEVNLDPQAAVYWDKDRKMAWLRDGPRWSGLRLVGMVQPEPYRHSGSPFFDISRNAAHYLGWFTDPDGYCSKDGDGLIWGVVCQLPGINSMSRLVAGYEVGGNGGICLDLSRVWYASRRSDDEPLVDMSEARDAAIYADKLAMEVAEEDRAYQQQQREEEEE